MFKKRYSDEYQLLLKKSVNSIEYFQLRLSSDSDNSFYFTERRGTSTSWSSRNNSVSSKGSSRLSTERTSDIKVHPINSKHLEVSPNKEIEGKRIRDNTLGVNINRIREKQVQTLTEKYFSNSDLLLEDLDAIPFTFNFDDFKLKYGKAIRRKLALKLSFMNSERYSPELDPSSLGPHSGRPRWISSHHQL